MSAREFDDIFYADAKMPSKEGKLRIAPPGIGWKSPDDELYTIKADNLTKLQFTRCCRRYQLRIFLSSSQTVKFENFTREAFEDIRDAVRQNYSLPLELVEMCVKGMNWGHTELLASSLAFLSSGKPVFEIPYNQIYNVSAGKNEVALDFIGPKGAGESGTTAAAAAAAAAAFTPRHAKPDQLSEIRFYVPGMADDSDNDSDKDNDPTRDVDMTDADEPAAVSAADRLCQALKARSELGVEKSDTICSLKELPFLTPRGRYDVDMFMDFLRLRGKSYDYKIAYSSITRLFLLPKPGDQQMFFIINLNPPLRQGQTRYDFLVLQFLRDEEMQAEIKLDEDLIQEKFRGALSKSYDARAFEVVSSILGGMTNVRLTIPGAYRSPTSGGAGIKCSLKAQEGFLYALERELLFVPKLSRHIEHAEISHVTFSRVSGGSSRTFDLIVTLRGGAASVAFSNISREEYTAFEEYFSAKSIRTKNELSALASGGAGGAGLGASGLGIDDDLDDDDSDDDSGDDARASGRIDDDDDDDVPDSDDNDFIVASDSESNSEIDSDDLDSDLSDNNDDDDDDNGVPREKKRKLSARPAGHHKKSKMSRN